MIKEIKVYKMYVRNLIQKNNRLEQMQFHSHVFDLI